MGGWDGMGWEGALTRRGTAVPFPAAAGCAPHRRPPRLRGLRGGRPADGGGAAAAVRGGALRRDRKGAEHKKRRKKKKGESRRRSSFPTRTPAHPPPPPPQAHADVFNVLLQILDDGKVTDSQGRAVSFKNCVIILTSNIGAATVLDEGAARAEARVMAAVRARIYTSFFLKTGGGILVGLASATVLTKLPHCSPRSPTSAPSL